MTEIELARFRRQLREVSQEAKELTRTLRRFAAQCEEVSRIMRSIRDSYTLAAVPPSDFSTSSSGLDSECPLAETTLPKRSELTAVEGGRPSWYSFSRR